MYTLFMGVLKQFDKYDKPEVVLGSCCLDDRCKSLNIKDKTDKEC